MIASVTRFLSVDAVNDGRTRLHVDFTGDFGHEIGRLDLTLNDAGL